MPIKSYIAFAHPGLREDLEMCLRSVDHCEVIPSENKDVVVVVSNTTSEEEEMKFLDDLGEVESLDHFTLVAGFDETN